MPSSRQLHSIRYGYTLTLAPGWSVAKGDCASYAVIGAGHTLDTIEIFVTPGVLSNMSLPAAQAAVLAVLGTWLGAAVYGVLRLQASRK